MEKNARVMVELMPNATIKMGGDAGGGMIAVALWMYWAELSVSYAAKAKIGATPHEVLDARSAQIAGDEVDVPEAPGTEGKEEVLAGMVAVAASAHALDGFYGSVKPLINPPASDAARGRQILELLKLGFKVGKRAHAWLAGLDWLFLSRGQRCPSRRGIPAAGDPCEDGRNHRDVWS